MASNSSQQSVIILSKPVKSLVTHITLYSYRATATSHQPHNKQVSRRVHEHNKLWNKLFKPNILNWWIIAPKSVEPPTPWSWSKPHRRRDSRPPSRMFGLYRLSLTWNARLSVWYEIIYIYIYVYIYIYIYLFICLFIYLFIINLTFINSNFITF